MKLEGSATFIIDHVLPFPLNGHGKGFWTTKDGEVVHYTGQGVGRPTGPVKMSFRGVAIARTKSGKLARLNGVAILFEYEVDMEKGPFEAKYWELK